MAKELPPEPEWRGVSGLRIVVPHGRPDVMLVEIKTLYGPVRLSIPQEHCAESRPIDCRRTREARARPVTFIADGANAPARVLGRPLVSPGFAGCRVLAAIARLASAACPVRGFIPHL